MKKHRRSENLRCFKSFVFPFPIDLLDNFSKLFAYLGIDGGDITDGLARFPDAPTQRGLRHVQHLTELKKQGYRAVVLIVIQMKGVHTFSPNWETHADFGFALRDAQAAGVEIYAYDCIVTEDSTIIDQPVKIVL